MRRRLAITSEPGVHAAVRSADTTVVLSADLQSPLPVATYRSAGASGVIESFAESAVALFRRSRCYPAETTTCASPSSFPPGPHQMGHSRCCLTHTVDPTVSGCSAHRAPSESPSGGQTKVSLWSSLTVAARQVHRTGSDRSTRTWQRSSLQTRSPGSRRSASLPPVGPWARSHPRVVLRRLPRRTCRPRST